MVAGNYGKAGKELWQSTGILIDIDDTASAS